MEGFATMYMPMPMSKSALPIQGSCAVDEKHISFKFPFTGIEFDLPDIPKEDSSEKIEFKIRSTTGDMIIEIEYNPELHCFAGTGKAAKNENNLISFCFFSKESAMSKLPKFG